VQALDSLADDILQHLLVEQEVRNYLLQPLVLILQLLQPLHLGWR
jgi:hypothetical protein